MGATGQGEYVVKQGECIESISYLHGLFWQTVWNDPANSELKEARKQPNALLPGDCVHVRPLELKKVRCAAEKRHRFLRRGVPSRLQLTFLDEGEPRAGVPYVLVIDGREFRGKTDAQGTLKAPLMPDAASASLVLGEDPDAERYTLELRHLNPASEISGAQQRLTNMGFYCGPIDGKLNEHTRMALRAFQSALGLEATAKIDESTANSLREVHDA